MERPAKVIWRQTTARFQPEHFAGAEPVLEAYCECAALLRDLLHRIKQTKAIRLPPPRGADVAPKAARAPDRAACQLAAHLAEGAV
jgi:hypothetical protein